MIYLEKVNKKFGDIVAVDGLSLEIEEGEVFGLLGPNGAGKTTLVNITVGLLEPDSGRVAINGDNSPLDPATRAMIGVAPQALAIYEDLTGRENLLFFGKLQGLTGKELSRQVDSALEFVKLTDRQKDKVKNYSGGMQRRINLAAALLHDPPLLLFDEPTVGVDPQSRNAIFENIIELRKQGRTILYTTHYMEEAQRLCDRVGIIDHGKLLAMDTVEGLINTHGGKDLVVAETADGELRLETDEPVAELEKLKKQGGLLRFWVERPNLEKVFLNLTGRQLRD